MSVIEGSRGATALVGMPGLVVGAQQVIEGELWLFAETDIDLMGCSSCGTRAVGHGRQRTLVRDLPVSGRPTVLWVAKRRWRCPEPDCEVNTWTEQVEGIAPRAVLTDRARRRIAEMVNHDGDSIAAAAAAFGVGWHCANQAVAVHTDPHVDDPDRLVGVEAIGVDEKRFLNATPTSRTRYTTQIVDLDRHRVLDVLEGRSRDVVGEWLSERGTEWSANIRLATLDPSAGYRRALEDHLGNATLVVDHWHVVRVRHEALCYPVGMKGPHLWPVAAGYKKLGAAWPWRCRVRVGSSPDKAGTGRYRQTARVRQARQKGARRLNQWWNPLKREHQLKSGGYGLGRQRGADLIDGEATPKPVTYAGGEAMVKACGVAMDRLSGEKLGIDPVNGYIVNVGTVPGFPSPPAGQVGGGKAHRRLMISGRGGGSVVVRDRESRSHGEGTQRVSSRSAGMPRGRL